MIWSGFLSMFSYDLFFSFLSRDLLTWGLILHSIPSQSTLMVFVDLCGPDLVPSPSIINILPLFQVTVMSSWAVLFWTVPNYMNVWASSKMVTQWFHCMSLCHVALWSLDSLSVYCSHWTCPFPHGLLPGEPWHQDAAHQNANPPQEWLGMRSIPGKQSSCGEGPSPRLVRLAKPQS